VNSDASKTLVMTRQGSSYKATIPKQAKGAVVEFYILVTDTAGTVSESSEYAYTVGGGGDLPDLEIPGFPWNPSFLAWLSDW